MLIARVRVFRADEPFRTGKPILQRKAAGRDIERDLGDLGGMIGVAQEIHSELPERLIEPRL